MKVGKLLWKRHIDQLRELAGSKEADVEPNGWESPEIELLKTLEASVPVPTQDPPPQQSVPDEKSTTPFLKFHHLNTLLDKKKMLRIMLFQPFQKRRSTRIRSRRKRLIEEL